MPVEIVWSPLALARLREIRAYVALDKPNAAEHLATRIVAVVEALRNHPYLGRAGAEPGISELAIGSPRALTASGGSPYMVVLYQVRRKRVVISTIWHGAQRKER